MLSLQKITNSKILHDISLSAKTGEFIVLSGQNGSGKSTLLRLLAHLEKSEPNPFLSYKEKLIEDFSTQETSETIAWLGVNSEPSFGFSVLETSLMGRYPWHKGKPQTKDLEKCWKSLESFGLKDKAHRSFYTLSSGEKKLAELARVFSGEQEIFFLDEPEAHLDLKNAINIFSFLKRKAEEGKIVFIASHHIRLAKSYAHRILLLKSGKLIADISPKDEKLTEVIAEAFELKKNEAYTLI